MFATYELEITEKQEGIEGQGALLSWLGIGPDSNPWYCLKRKREKSCICTIAFLGAVLWF
jgi:hypothetical protein